MATADVRLFQARVIDKRSELKSVVVWQCGPDVLYAGSMENFFAGRVHNAPKWLREQLENLPPSRAFDFLGNSRSSGETSDITVPRSAPVGDVLDEDAPGVVQG